MMRRPNTNKFAPINNIYVDLHLITLFAIILLVFSQLWSTGSET